MTCTGPKCSRPVVAFGLCGTHYMQRVRGTAIRPIRERGDPLVPLTIRVPKSVLTALAAAGQSPSVVARDVLERWESRRAKRGPALS